MSVNLNLASLENNAQISVAAQICHVAHLIQDTATTTKQASEHAIDLASGSTFVTNLTDVLSTDMHAGSNFQMCPDASIPTNLAVNPDAHTQKMDALATYAKKFPTEPTAIQNMLLYANNLADTAQLTVEMKESVIRNVQTAAINSAQRASVKGYQGLRGTPAATQFLSDALAPFKPQLIQAMNTTSGNGSSAPNGLGSKSKAPAPAKSQSHSAPAPILPTPVLPNSGATPPPAYDFPEGGSVGLKGLKDYYAQMLEYLHAHPGDIRAMQDLMEFLVKITNFYKGNIPADVSAILAGGPSGNSGAITAINSIIPRLAQYAFFAGYGSEKNNGASAMMKYVNDMITTLGQASGGPFTAAMKAALTKQKAMVPYFAEAHTDAKGRLFYTQNMPGTAYSATYYWDNCDDSGKPIDNGTMTSQQFITQIINNQNPDDGTTADPFNTGLDSDINSIESTYRVSALQDLLAKYKDPLTAITLWIMQVYDNQYQTQEGGLNETTDDLTQMTNDIATRLSTLAQHIGFTGVDKTTGMPTGQMMTADEVKNFARTLANGSTSMDSLYQMAGISSQWDKDVFQDICGITLTDPINPKNGQPTYEDPKKPPHFPKTVGQLLYGNAPDTGKPYTPDEKATYLCTLNMGPPPVSPTGETLPVNPPASLNQGYQEIIGNLQQAGSLITGRSKVVSLQLQQTSDCDSQDIKAWSTMLQDLAQFILKGPIAGQKQN